MHVVEGEFEFTLDGETKVYTKGDVVVIPSNTPHSGIAMTPCRLWMCLALQEKITNNYGNKVNRENALVGGSSRGIGQAIALRLAASGANVTLMASDLTRLNETLVLLDQSKGQKHQFVKVDFNDFSSFEEEMKRYFSSNTVDILVNNTQGPFSWRCFG